MSYLHKPHTKPLEHRTPVQLLHQHVATHPHKEAFVFRDQKMTRVSLTFQEYEMKSRSLAAAFLEIGLVRGDRVLVILPTSIEFLLVHMALNRLGANTIFTEEDAFPSVDKVKDLACVIVRTPYWDKVGQKILSVLLENKLKAAVIVGPSAGALNHDKVYNYEKLLHMGQTNPDCDNTVQRAEAAVQMDDPALILFTSGSTSTPKPIQYTYHGYVNGVRKNAALMTLNNDTIFFLDGPLNRFAGLCMGIGVVIAMGSTLLFSPPKLAIKGGIMVPTILEVIAEEGCTDAFLFSYFLHDMTTCNEIQHINLKKLKKVLTGGQPTAVALLKRIFQMLPHLTIIQLYGATEMNLVLNEFITKDSIETSEYGAMDMVDGLELKIVDEEGQIVPLNTKGELCARGSSILCCSWEVLEIDVNPTTVPGKNRWHFSRDNASLDEHGKVRLHGRTSDTIKYAADTVSPFEIEDLLFKHPEVKNVCVIGVPDQRFYENICACIILKNCNQNDMGSHLEEAFDDWCKGRCRESSKGLPIKPQYYIFVDSFPLTKTGKFSRRLIRELAIKKLKL